MAENRKKDWVSAVLVVLLILLILVFYENSELVTGGYEESQYTTRSFAVVDIEQDGVYEAVLRGTSETGGTAYTVLREDAANGVVVGNVVGENETFFKASGYYGHESSDGEFMLWRYSFDREDVPEASTYGDGSCYLGNMPVSQEEYEAHLRKIGWDEMEDALFYDYTGENIRRFAP